MYLRKWSSLPLSTQRPILSLQYSTSQSTYLPRVPPCLSLRRNWTPPPSPLQQASVYPSLPPEPNVGGTRSPAGEGVGESQFGRLEKKFSTLCTPILPLCYFVFLHILFTNIFCRSRLDNLYVPCWTNFCACSNIINL